MGTLAVVLLTAVTSALMTVLLLWFLFRFWLRRGLVAELEEISEELRTEFEKELLASAEAMLPEFQQGLREAFSEAAEELLPDFKEEVSKGFEETAQELLPEFRAEVTQGLTDAAVELLPEFRNQVRLGFQDGMSDVMTGAMVEKTARKVTQKGSSILGSGLDLLFGKINGEGAESKDDR